VPTVYSKDKWAQRRLGESELGHTMDYPGDKIQNIIAYPITKTLECPSSRKVAGHSHSESHADA
jgi:hypothetical protein